MPPLKIPTNFKFRKTVYPSVLFPTSSRDANSYIRALKIYCRNPLHLICMRVIK